MGPSFTTKYADFTEARTPPWGIALLGENLQSRMALGYLLLLPRTLIHCLKTSMSLIQLLLPAVAEAALSPIEDENKSSPEAEIWQNWQAQSSRRKITTCPRQDPKLLA